MSGGDTDAPSAVTARIFISYSRKDLAFVDRLEEALTQRGYEALIDRSEIYAFEDWWERIEALLARADTIVFVLSPDSVASDVALKEVNHAVALKKRLAPIVWRRVRDDAVPDELRRLNFIFFDDPAHFETSADRLAQALQTDIGWIRQSTEFCELARRWSASGRLSGLLLRPPVLEEAERWLRSRPSAASEPPDETKTFIAFSRQNEYQVLRRARRVKVIVGLMLVGLVALGGLSYGGWLNRSYLMVQGRRLLDLYMPAALSAEQERGLKPGDRIRECASCPEMVVIPAGEFLRGSPDNEGRDDERPRQKAFIARAFAVSLFEITFEQWDGCVAHGGCAYEAKNQAWGRGLQPVNRVSWNDANAYVAWLSRQTGKQYRLLTEAEWEHSARAGAATRYAHGDDAASLHEHAWYALNSENRPRPVGTRKANRFGLFDMGGNLWEWVQDCYTESYDGAPIDGSAVLKSLDDDADCIFRVLRGGSWFSQADDIRPAARYGYTARFRNDNHGFRVARTIAGMRVEQAR